MKKIVCLLTVLLLCMSLVVPVFATETGFVPSITYKPNPEIVPVPDAPEDAIGVVRDPDGNIISYVPHGCLKITPIADVWNVEIEVPEVIEELLLYVYDELNNGDMKIPYDKHNAGLNAANMVIRDLFDARWTCEEHRAMIEQEGYTFELTFKLGVVADAQIFVMTFDEETEEWDPIVKTVNNGDGTVTCTFEHLCAIEFSMPLNAVTVPSEEVQSPNLLPWIISLVVAVIAFVVILATKKKKKETV